jgi:hypothetical protein
MVLGVYFDGNRWKILMRERELRLKRIRSSSVEELQESMVRNRGLLAQLQNNSSFSFADRTANFDLEEELLVDSPGGFAFSPRQQGQSVFAEPHSPSAIHM